MDPGLGRHYALAYNLFGMGALIVAPAIPVILVDLFQAPFTVVGVLALAQGAAWTLGFRFRGRVADRWSGPTTSWLSTFAQAAIPAGLIMAIVLGNVWLLMVAYVAIGLDGAGNEIGWQTSLTSMATPAEMNALATTFFVSVGIRGLIAPFLGGVLLLVSGPLLTLGVALGFVAVGNLLMLRLTRTFVPVPDEPETA